jgi:hypothetical protein
LWVNIHIAMMNKKSKTNLKYFVQMPGFQWKREGNFYFSKNVCTFLLPWKVCHHFAIVWKKKLWTIFLNLSSINAKSTLVCLPPIPTYFRQLENRTK